jgi:hypothetical protein
VTLPLYSALGSHVMVYVVPAGMIAFSWGCVIGSKPTVGEEKLGWPNTIGKSPSIAKYQAVTRGREEAIALGPRIEMMNASS